MPRGPEKNLLVWQPVHVLNFGTLTGAEANSNKTLLRLFPSLATVTLIFLSFKHNVVWF